MQLKIRVAGVIFLGKVKNIYSATLHGEIHVLKLQTFLVNCLGLHMKTFEQVMEAKIITTDSLMFCAIRDVLG